MNMLGKLGVRLVMVAGCLVSVALYATEAHDQKKAPRKEKKGVELSETDLKTLLLELNKQATLDGYDTELPKDFKIVCSALKKGRTLSRPVLEQALVSLGNFVDQSKSQLLGDRASRPDGESSTQPVGPGCCCDLTQIERLLAIIRTRIGTTSDDECDQSVLGILGNACIILGMDISTAIKLIIDELAEIDSKLCGCCATVVTSTMIVPSGYTIAEPGYYLLCGSAGLDAPVTPSCIIRIQASNVTLDFNQHTIYQTDADANFTGVCVDAGFDDIVIKNGKISGVTGSGITVATSSQDIYVTDMTVRGCGSAGIAFSGTTGARNRDVEIVNSSFTNNGSNGGTFTFTEKVKIINSKFNDNTVIGASFDSSNGNEIIGSMFCKNGGAGNGIGLSLNATGSSVIRDCTFNANFSSTGTARGLLLTSTGNLVDNCVADGNSSTVSAGFAIGFDIDGTAHFLNNCTATGNAATTGGGSIGVGFRVVSTAFRCLIKNGTSLTNSARGFEHDATAGYNSFIGCFAFGHIGNANNYFGSGLGFISVATGAQPPSGSFDERAVSNISMI